jgi:hypothetical protein
MKLPSSLLRQTIAVEPYLGNTASGPRYGTAVNIKARVERRRQVVGSPVGNAGRSGNQVVVASAVAFVRPDVEIATQSRVTWDGDTFDVIDVRNGQGLTRPTHLELVLA